MAERHHAGLARLGELSLSLAEHLHERALAAETPKEARELGLAFQRIARSYRQTVLLQARLQKDHRLAAREDATIAEKHRATLRQERKDRLRRTIRLEILEACEQPEEAEDLLDELEERLEGYLDGHDFDAAPLEALIDQVRDDFLEFVPDDEAGPPIPSSRTERLQGDPAAPAEPPTLNDSAPNSS